MSYSFYYKIRVCIGFCCIYYNVRLTTVINFVDELLNFVRIDERLSICFCLDYHLTRINAILIACALWIVSFAISTPIIYHAELIELPSLCGSFCVMPWENETTRHAYVLFRLAIDYVIPIAVMVFCYRSVTFYLCTMICRMGQNKQSDDFTVESQTSQHL